MLRTPPSPNQKRAHTPRKLGFALCCHSNATHAPIANPPNSARLGAASTTPPSYIRVRAVMWAYGRGQTHRRALPRYILRRLRLTQNVIRKRTKIKTDLLRRYMYDDQSIEEDIKLCENCTINSSDQECDTAWPV